MRTVKNNNDFKLHRQIALFAVYFCVPLFLYLPYIIQKRVLVYGDALGFYRIKEILLLAISDGELPLWNKYLANGIPYAADFTGVFYPFSWFVLFMPMYVFIYFFYAIHVAIGSFYTQKYLKEIGVDGTIAALTGFIYAVSVHLNGPRKNHIMIIAVIVYLPVVIYYMQKFLNTNKRGWLIASSLALGLSFLAGFPQDQLYIDAIAFLYFLIWCVAKKVNWRQALKNLMLWIGTFIGFIQIQIIPTIELMLEYSRNGAAGMSYEEFRTFSMHPLKIIMMIFPEIFGGSIFSPGGSYVSSEMDIEIYLGIAVCIVLMAGIVYCRKKYYVLCSFIICVTAFLYACIGNIPLLGKLVYHVPLVGSFRCNARILFAFVFFAFIAFACILNEMLTDNMLKPLIQVNRAITKIFFEILFLGIMCCVLLGTQDGDYFVSARKAWDMFQKPCLISLGCLVIFVCADKYMESHRNSVKAVKTIVPILLTLIIAADVYVYTSITNDVPETAIFNEDEIAYYQLIANGKQNAKAIVANSNIDGSYESLLSTEKGIHYRIPAINSYTSLNNPKLYMLLSPDGVIGAKQNFSGLFTGFENIDRDILEHNDILSMMGIKYIVDPQENVPADGMSIKNKEDVELVFSTQGICVESEGDIVSVNQWEIDLDSSMNYSIYAVINNMLGENTTGYFDFYAGEKYDSEEQRKTVTLEPGINVLYFNIPSGDAPQDEQVYMRFMTIENCRLEIKNLYLYQGILEFEKTYKLVVDDGKERIFENISARDILFAPQQVVGVPDFEDLYKNQSRYDFNNVSYVIGEEMFENSVVQIRDIIWGNNYVNAKVECAGKSFLNYSNNYYPGWRAYVDGQKTQIVEVNGLIQGVFLDEGEHFVEIIYQPYSVWIGVGLTGLTIVMAAWIIYREKRKGIIPKS